MGSMTRFNATRQTIRGVLAAALIAGSSGGALAVVGGTTTDQWDVAVDGTAITGSSGFLAGALACGLGMFGGNCSIFGTAPLFSDSHDRGFVHWVEWTTATSKTITSFNLSAAHDGHDNPVGTPPPVFPLPAPYSENRDANHRGFNHFTLYACEFDPCDVSANRTVLYDAPIPLAGDDDVHPGEGALLYDPTGALGALQNILDITNNVLALVETNKWRAEFTQQGRGPCPECGPRILELDGFVATTLPVDIVFGDNGVPNVNLCSHGVVSVAVLSTETFDATFIDPATVTVADATVRMAGKSGIFQATIDDVNLDGLDDQIFNIELVELSLTGEGPVAVELHGETFAPVQSIAGNGTLNIVKNCE